MSKFYKMYCVKCLQSSCRCFQVEEVKTVKNSHCNTFYKQERHPNSKHLTPHSLKPQAETFTKIHKLLNSLVSRRFTFITMSDEDLDAFFDEVEEVVEEVKKECGEDGHEDDLGDTTKDNNAETTTDKIARKSTNTTADGREDQTDTIQDGSDRPAKKARLESHEGTATQTGSALYQDGTGNVQATTTKNTTGAGTTGTGTGTVVVSKKAATISAPPVRNSSVTNSYTSQSKDEIYQITVPERPIPPPPPAHPQPPLPPFQYNNQQSSNQNAKPSVRLAAGKQWVDATLNEFPENDYRLFVGNLDKIITEQKLAEAFQSKYPSFAMCRIIYDKTSGDSKGYGFVSVLDPKDCARAIREMNQSWLGSRPIKVTRSDWKERDLREVRKGKKKKGKRR